RSRRGAASRSARPARTRARRRASARRHRRPRPSRGRGGARADSATSVACHTAGVVRASVLLSFPERTVRALAAVVGGVAHETAELVLPRLVRRSRLYEASAK